MVRSDRKHKVGDKVWVYSFHRLGGKEGHFHNIKPAYGLIVGSHGVEGLDQDLENGHCWNVVLYKNKKGKFTDELSGKQVGILKVSFAESYEQAVEEYNKLVEKEANFYKEKLEQVESYLIK